MDDAFLVSTLIISNPIMNPENHRDNRIYIRVRLYLHVSKYNGEQVKKITCSEGVI